MTRSVGDIEQLDSDGRVSLYLRRLKRGNVYYARFKIGNRALANGQRYLEHSLKTSDRSIAIGLAQEWLAELKFLERSNASLKRISVAKAIDRFIQEYERRLKIGVAGHTKPMLRNYQKSVVRYWREYIGNKLLENVGVHDFENYEVWRREYWVNRKRDSRYHGNVKLEPSQRTIQWEIGSFKRVLRWARDNRLYAGNAIEWTYKRGEHQRRSAFMLEQYRCLHRFMRSRAWLESGLGKHNSDKRIARYRRMLRAYVLFMVNTGLRPGEARNLRWRDVEFRANKLSQKVVVVDVSASHSKVKKRRQVIGRATAARALERLLVERSRAKDHVGKDDFIWCDVDGSVIADFREGFNALIRKAGVEKDRSGSKHAIYSLRHTYITFRLRFGERISIYSLAENCGTSVQMIERYYSDARPSDFVDELTL